MLGSYGSGVLDETHDGSHLTENDRAIWEEANVCNVSREKSYVMITNTRARFFRLPRRPLSRDSRLETLFAILSHYCCVSGLSWLLSVFATVFDGRGSHHFYRSSQATTVVHSADRCLVSPLGHANQCEAIPLSYIWWTIFLRDIYDLLRLNSAHWQKTRLS